MRSKAGMKFDCIFEETLDFIDIDYTHLNKTIRYEQRPHGEWKYESYGQYLSTYKCSNCGFHGDKQWICCPYCGTDMRKEGDTSEVD